MQQKETKTAIRRGKAIVKMAGNIKEDNEDSVYPDPTTLSISPSRRSEPVAPPRRITGSSFKAEVTSSDSVETDLDSSDYQDTPTKKTK